MQRQPASIRLYAGWNPAWRAIEKRKKLWRRRANGTALHPFTVDNTGSNPVAAKNAGRVLDGIEGRSYTPVHAVQLCGVLLRDGGRRNFTASA